MTLALMARGQTAELLFSRVLTQARFEDATAQFTAGELLGTAMRIDPAWVARVNTHRLLHRCTAAQVLDFVYGIDHLLDLGDGVLVGLDSTVNTTKVNDKVLKARDHRRLWAAIGVQHVGVVELIGDPSRFCNDTLRCSVQQFWDELGEALHTGLTVGWFRFAVS